MPLSNSPDELRGMAAFDVDGTLYNPNKRILAAPFSGDLKFSSGLLKAVSAYGKKKLGILTRDEFAAVAADLYGNILKENGSERISQFYTDVARETEKHNHGSIDLIQGLIRNGILTVFISGGHDQFIETLLRENGIDPTDERVKIIASKFEQDKEGNYTGKVLESNIDSSGKKRVIEQLKAQYPDLPLVCAAGDDEADIPLFENVVEGGLAVAFVDSGFAKSLSEQGFTLYTDIPSYVASTDNKKALSVKERPKKGKATLQDVADHLPELLSLQ